MSATADQLKIDTKATVTNALTLTSRLRWLKTSASKVLQQEYRNVFTGKTEWRDVEIVTQDKAE